MVVSINNLNTNQAVPEKGTGPAVSVDDIQLTEATKLQEIEQARSKGKSLATEIGELPKVQELKSLPILNKISNSGKKLISLAFKVAGFAGASLSIMTYFIFNLRSVAMLLGVPTAMAFFIAHVAGKSAKDDTVGFSNNPNEMLNETINNPGLLETNLNRVLQAVEQIKDMKDSDPQKKDGIELVEKLNIIVDSKLMQIKGFEESIPLQHELERFKVAYDEMQANMGEPTEQLTPQQELHKTVED